MSERDPLRWLEEWYAARCDGDWEHTSGVSIDTLDNPGWSIQIDVGDDLPSFDRVKSDGGADWLEAWLEDGQLNVVCGPRSLQRALTLLRETLEES